MARIGHVVVGPDAHGVVRYALTVGDALHASGERHTVVRLRTPDSELPSLDHCSLVHLHVNDRLFGRSPAAAAEALQTLTHRIGVPVSMTLHDLPQPSDGAAMDVRAGFYRTAVASAVGIVVSSEHEASLLAQHVDASAKPEVVPLMIDSVRRTPRGPTTATTVGVLGFLYPGKGHIETLKAMEDLPEAVGFVALGSPSPGHEDIADTLRAAAAGTGRACEVTGYLTEDEIHERAARVTVPVAYHRHMSASGSINTWIAAGRRPLVPRSTYSEELDARSPGLVLVHDADEASLRRAIAASIADPSGTWIDPETVPRPTPADVAEAHTALFERWAE
ncbi:MAG: hypothetical protein WBQ44_23285 [Rhodococcus sp. (in: high G+C Gram-positive bacteria)]